MTPYASVSSIKTWKGCEQKETADFKVSDDAVEVDAAQRRVGRDVRVCTAEKDEIAVSPG
jgi:hypothetical protein